MIHDVPRYLAAREVFVAEPAEGADPDDTFARRAIAAHVMWCISKGREPVEGSHVERLGVALADYGLLRLSRLKPT